MKTWTHFVYLCFSINFISKNHSTCYAFIWFVMTKLMSHILTHIVAVWWKMQVTTIYWALGETMGVSLIDNAHTLCLNIFIKFSFTGKFVNIVYIHPVHWKGTFFLTVLMFRELGQLSYELNNHGIMVWEIAVWFLAWARYFCFLQSTEPGSLTHVQLQSVGTRTSFPGVRQLQH